MVYAVSPGFDAAVFQGALASSRTELRDSGRVRWVPRVPAAERKAFEAATHGGRRLRIIERSPQGRLVPAGERAEYFPIASLEPREPDPGALGFDMVFWGRTMSPVALLGMALILAPTAWIAARARLPGPP